MGTKDLTIEMFIDKWLYKNYNLTCVDMVEKYPEESKSGQWFKLFPVTREEHDLWYDWAIVVISKKYRCGKKRAMKMFALSYLNTAPNIIKDE
jgi:hypothetical protein